MTGRSARRGLAGAFVLATIVLTVGRPAAAATGPQRFVTYQRPGQQHMTVVAQGPISGVGTDILTSQTFDPQTGTLRRTTETIFPQGTTFNTLTVGRSTNTFDPVSCVGRSVGTSHLDITGGTGAFTGASGSGEVVFEAILVHQRTAQGCSPEPQRSYLVARVTGSATVP